VNRTETKANTCYRAYNVLEWRHRVQIGNTNNCRDTLGEIGNSCCIYLGGQMDGVKSASSIGLPEQCMHRQQRTWWRLL